MTNDNKSNQDIHDFHKQIFTSQTKKHRDYLTAKRTLGFETQSHDESSDHVFAAAFYIAQLFDGYSIAQAREILTEAIHQIELSHQVSARMVHSLSE